MEKFELDTEAPTVVTADWDVFCGHEEAYEDEGAGAEVLT
jgi:hypothetical protein